MSKRRNVDIQSLMHDMNMCVEAIQDLRKQNPEALPSPIWEKLFRMTNICPTFKIVLAVFAERKLPQTFGGWTLKQRPEDDLSWPGIYHAPGIVLHPKDTPEAINRRFLKKSVAITPR